MNRNERQAVRACDRYVRNFPDPVTDWECDDVNQIVVTVVGERFGIHPEELMYLWTCEAPNEEMQRQWEADRLAVLAERKKLNQFQRDQLTRR